MFNDNQSICRQHGFTLVEVMIALLIFMVIALGLAQGEIAALRAQTENSFRDEALRIAEDRLNDLKGKQFTLSNVSSDLMATNWTTPESLIVNMRGGTVTFVRSIQISDITASATALKRIDVAVGWNHGNNATRISPTNSNHQAMLNTIIVRSE